MGLKKWIGPSGIYNNFTIAGNDNQALFSEACGRTAAF